jgi:methylglutaconyl-CoA hydratase
MSDTPYEFIDFSATPGGLAVITLNRPDVHNAFNAELIAELTDAFEMLAGQTSIRMLILRGAGKSFSAGADLNWMKHAAEATRKDNEDDALKLAEMLRKLYTLPQMTLALVHGSAMGGGIGLIAACDVAVAMKTAQFRFSEVRLGLTPATISPFVIDAIGPRWARALFVTGETFDAAYAERIGLVQYVVETDQQMSDMEEYLAGLVFAAAPGAIDDAKSLVRGVTGQAIDKELSKATAQAIAGRRASDEGKEGVAAFLEKRSPGWKV